MGTPGEAYEMEAKEEGPKSYDGHHEDEIRSEVPDTLSHAR
jgi:hypothetical protein